MNHSFFPTSMSFVDRPEAPRFPTPDHVKRTPSRAPWGGGLRYAEQNVAGVQAT